MATHRLKTNRRRPLPPIRPASDTPIVAIGASAGGLKPLMKLFSGLSSNTGMAFVVIQHLRADKESLLPQILATMTKMPVCPATNGRWVMPDTVYVLTPNTRLTVRKGVLVVKLRTEHSGDHKPFDRFLISLALDKAEVAIGVVLSGYDGDGAEGFIKIKQRGGMTFAQNDTALIKSMPHEAIATGCVDFILSPGKIALRLSHLSKKRLVERISAPPPTRLGSRVKAHRHSPETGRRRG
ncbi:MAG: chemotaxis protein CheB [Elusimicrobiota bacterium]|nr:chemotaxis protein CheB [Elusimicrobiota bacterium]